MTDLRKAAEMALETLERLDKWLALRYGNELTSPETGVVNALRQALAQPEDPRIVELRTLMQDPSVTGVLFEVHRGPLSKSIREYGECSCPTHVEGDVRIEVKDD